MDKLFIKIKNAITKNLNEFVKWVIILALYLFHRMMAAIYPSEDLDFLVLPLILIAISILISDKIIDHLISFSSLIKGSDRKNSLHSKYSVLISIFYFAGIISMLTYFVISLYSLINLTLFFMLSSGLLAYIDLFQRHEKHSKLIIILTFLTITTGVAACIHGFIFQNNAVNFLSFIFYALFMFNYFVSNYLLKESLTKKS